MVVEHLAKAGEGARGRVFKNARFLNTSRRRTLPRAGGLIPMPTLPVTYGYARVSKSDDEARNLETQLRLLADHGIRQDLIFSDIATGRTLRRTGWQELVSRLRPGDTLAVAFLDRLSRNFVDGVRIQADLTERNIGIVALRENIDTSDTGRISLSRPTLACRLCVLAKRLRLCLAVPERRTVPPTSANPIRFSYQARRR